MFHAVIVSIVMTVSHVGIWIDSCDGTEYGYVVDGSSVSVDLFAPQDCKLEDATTLYIEIERPMVQSIKVASGRMVVLKEASYVMLPVGFSN